MANIEQLNFSLIINESEFDEQIKRVKDKADELNTSITNILGANKKIVPFSDADVKNVENVAKAFKEVAKAEGLAAREAAKTNSRKRTEDAKAEAAAIKEAAKAQGVEARETLKTEIAQERLNRLQKEHTSLLGRSSRLWREMGTMVAAYFSVHGAVSLVRTLTRITGEFEMQKITLGAILRDSQAAGKIFEQIKELAVQSPFQFKELVTYTKQLSAFSVPVEELYETTKMLADVSAGLGVGMDRLVLAYGQIRSASFLRGQEVRQLTEAGIPILEELRKQFVELGEEGITVGDVFDKISKRMVPFEMVEKVFKGMTEDGGKFYKMQEVQADTLKGKISNLTDAYQIMFAEIGDKKSGFLKGAVDMARSLAENYERVGRVLVSLVAAYGAYKAMSTAMVAIHRAELIALKLQITTQEALGKIISKNIAKTAAWKAVMQVAKNPYALVAAGLAAVGTYLVATNAQAKKFRMELEEIAKSQYKTAEDSAKKFHDLVQQLKGATKGSQEYRDAISELNRQYGEYLPNLLNEKNALNELIRLEGEVTNAIYARARAYAEVEGTSAIEDKQGKRVNAAIDTIKDRLISAGFSKEAARDIITNFEAAIKESPAADAGGLLTKLLKNQFDGAKQYTEWLQAHNNEYTSLILSAQTYAKRVDKLTDAYSNLEDIIDFRWGEKGYSSKKEREAMEGIISEYEGYAAEIRKQELPEGETQARLRENAIAQLKAMREAYVQLAQEAESDDLAGAWNNKLSEIDKKLEEMGPAAETWLQSIVKPFATGNNRDLAAEIGESFTEYTDRIRKEWEAVAKDFDDADKSYRGFLKSVEEGANIDEKALQKSKELRDDYEARKKSIEGIASAIHISLTKSSGGGGGSAADPFKGDIESIQTQITLYKKLKDAYADLIEYLDDSQARDFLATMFPSDMAYADFDTEIRRLTQSLYGFGEAGVKAARGLEEAMNDEKIKAYLKHLKEVADATEKANAAMKKVESVSGLFGEGAEFDISKALKKYKERLKDIKEERQEAIDAVYDEASKTGIFGLGYLEKGTKIDQWAMQEEADALAELNEEVRRQAEAWVRSWDGIASIDISHMADLTTNELNKLMEALQKLSQNPEQYFSDDLKLGFEETENSLKVFIAAIQEYVSQLNSQAEEKKWDKIVKKIRLYHDALKISTKALKELSDTAGWSGISDLADHLDRAADAATTFVKNLAEGDPLGAAMTAISYVVEEMIHLATAAVEYRNTLREIEVEMNALNHAAMLTSGVNSIFGTDTYRALKNAYNLLDLMEGKISGLRDTLGSITAHVDKSKWWQFLLAPTNWYGWFQHFFGKESFSSLLDELGADLFDETGRVNVEVIELLQSKYDKLSASEKAALEQAIQDAKDFNAALDQIDDTMSELVGNIADNFADAIIDQWKEAGDAAADYGEILDDLATQYAKMYIRNNILENVFDPEFEEQLKKMTLGMDAAGVMSLFDEKVKELEDYYPFFEDVLNGLSGYFDTSEADTKNTLGGGIKSITEDTANLLASYVNAIRADVAAIRQAMVAGNTNTLPSPTLAEYLTQIQANTYNTAQNTANLLERIDSVMTMSDGPAIRVFM